jgi:hypothetical protein
MGRYSDKVPIEQCGLTQSRVVPQFSSSSDCSGLIVAKMTDDPHLQHTDADGRALKEGLLHADSGGEMADAVHQRTTAP